MLLKFCWVLLNLFWCSYIFKLVAPVLPSKKVNFEPCICDSIRQETEHLMLVKLCNTLLVFSNMTVCMFNVLMKTAKTKQLLAVHFIIKPTCYRRCKINQTLQCGFYFKRQDDWKCSLFLWCDFTHLLPLEN